MDIDLIVENLVRSRAMNSRAKGARSERELAHKLTELGFESRRGQQFCGKNGDADVVSDSLPHIHIECKNVQKLNLRKAMEQSIRDAREGETPMVFHKKDRKPWLVTMSIEDWAIREKALIKERDKLE